MFFAIRNDNGSRHFFEWRGVDEWETLAELKAAVAAWQKTVPPSYAARISFEICQREEKWLADLASLIAEQGNDLSW